MKKSIIVLVALFFVSFSLIAQWTNNQAATLVIGQPDFNGIYNALSANGLAGPYSVAIDVPNSKLYVGDADNRRVLRFSYPVTANQPTAELVFGQTDFTSDPVQMYFNNFGLWPEPTASMILNPMALAVYKGDLYVLDEFNDRVVRFAHAYNISANNPDADLVIGQSSFTVRQYACTANSLVTPWGMSVDTAGTLWIADSGNGRVLRFDHVDILKNGSSANAVYGQTDFTSGSLPATPAAGNFGLPVSVYSDGVSVWVSDRGFNRVLKISNYATKPNGCDADLVLGQPDFTSKTLNLAPAGMDHPFGICGDGMDNLYVTDQSNNRVLIFKNRSVKLGGAPADQVLGQPGFYSKTPFYGAAGFGSASITTMALDEGEGKLFVADMAASRVLQFNASAPLTGITEPAISGNDANPFQLKVARNPYDDNAIFSFQVPSQGRVTLRVFDAMGIKVADILNKNMQPGRYTVEWQGNTKAAGVCFYQLREGSVAASGKLITIK